MGQARAAQKTDRKARTGQEAVLVRRAGGIPLLEWIVASLGLALVVATLSFMGYRAYTRDGAAPFISIRVDAVEQMQDRFLVVIAAANVGQVTAADVKVEGRLERGTEVVEVSEMTYRYLPPDSERRGGLFFTRDPALYTLVIAAKGYEKP
jgi:uncharacterized protein (TIGR02588 family)